MDYHRIYNELINNRKSNPASGYTENHHILPKSLGGNDEPENLVSLTGREHWVAHLLLHKIHRKKQTAHACHMMAMKCEERGIPKVRNSRMYQSIRERLIKHWSANGKRRVGSANGSYGSRWICNVELQENKKISKNAIIPDGWIVGRNKWIRMFHICETCGQKFEDKFKKKNRKYCSHKCQPSPMKGKKMSDEAKRKISKTLSNKPRPYRVGLKYNKTGCGQVW